MAILYGGWDGQREEGIRVIGGPAEHKGNPLSDSYTISSTKIPTSALLVHMESIAPPSLEFQRRLEHMIHPQGLNCVLGLGCRRYKVPSIDQQIQH
jgi:hypothetical protein